MRTLIYKRTHPGDPDENGHFGVEDCMGQVRKWDFEAVIGVGGLSAEASSYSLDGKINWIGIGPHKTFQRHLRGPIVTFDHFVLYESDGPSFIELAPRLSRRVYENNVRVLLHATNQPEKQEVRKILQMAADAPPSARISTALKSRRHTDGNCSNRGCNICRSRKRRC